MNINRKEMKEENRQQGLGKFSLRFVLLNRIEIDKEELHSRFAMIKEEKAMVG